MDKKEVFVPAYWRTVGFDLHPFIFLQAEKLPSDMLQDTYVFDENEDKLVHEPNLSSLILAASGAGKTMARLYFELTFEKRPEFAKTLVVLHKKFPQQDPALLAAHQFYLLASIAESVWQLIAKNPERIHNIDQIKQTWWWSFLATFLSEPRLAYRLQDQPRLHQSYQLTGINKQWCQILRQEDLVDSLEQICDRLRYFDLEHIAILVDDCDRYNTSYDNLVRIVRPLLTDKNLYTLSNIYFKWFLPVQLQSFICETPVYKTTRIHVIEKSWTHKELRELLVQRLQRATNGQHKSLHQFAASNVPNLDDALIELALEHKNKDGQPRTLLKLAGCLFDRPREEAIITLEEWEYLKKTPLNCLDDISSNGQSAQYRQGSPFAFQSFSKNYQFQHRHLLRRTVEQRLNDADINNLAFDLSIEHEDLGRHKADKVRELIWYAERNQRQSELIRYLEEIRPYVSWEYFLTEGTIGDGLSL